ncbi:MAG: fatty acid desaturase [Gemmatimonadetes bacterium]|nr:fatty acid desaturase [Gemmatimonadota bacterium]
MNREFLHSASPEPHKARTRAILRAHPEIRDQIGKNPWSLGVIAGLVALQLGLAFVLRDASWWALFLTAYLAGALVCHSLYVLIHECAHNLLFRRAVPNTLAGILANVPSLIPSSVSFKRYHLKHHAFQGVYELDADLPSVWEARLIGNSPVGKALWLLLFPLFQMARPFRIREMSFLDGWVVLNMVVVLAFDVVLWSWLGPRAFAFLFLSAFFSIGLHPVGARWIQRHYLVDEEQETYSYYGRLNALAFNVGYHNEHHDFPSVPWNRLPRVKATAREYYEELTSYTSWGRLLLRFIFDPKLSLFSRMVRSERAGRTMSDPATPDLDLSRSGDTG